jgi:hypothetical protein
MTVCAEVHAPDDGRDLLIPLGHYLARIATGRDFEVVYDRATDAPIPADVLARWNATDWEAEAPTRPWFRYGPRRRTVRDTLDALELDVLYPALDRTLVAVERRLQSPLRIYLRHRADTADLDASTARRRFDNEEAARDLERRGEALRRAADALNGLPLCSPDSPTADELAALSTTGADR